MAQRKVVGGGICQHYKGGLPPGAFSEKFWEPYVHCRRADVSFSTPGGLVSAVAFHGAMLIGEPLQALRSDLILPAEAALEQKIMFIQISKPKAGRRGKGKVQHVRITDTTAVDLATAAFSNLQGKDCLLADSAGTYRRRWDKLIAAFQIPVELELTPGSLRAGGAVHSYHTNMRNR